MTMFATKMVDFDNVTSNSTTKEKDEVTGVLKKLVNELKDEECRTALVPEDIRRLCNLLQKFAGDGTSNLGKDVNINLCTECVRCLCNACVQNVENQNSVCQSGAVGSIKYIISSLTSSTDHKESHCVLLRCTVQLAGNLISGNKETRKMLWRDVFPQSFLCIFSYDDAKASDYCCMLLNECLTEELHIEQLIKQPEGQHIVEAVLRLCEKETQQDFSLQIMQKLIATTEFMLSSYDSLPTTAQIIVLEILAAVLSQSDEPSHTSWSTMVPVAKDGCKKDAGVPVFSLAYLSEQFEDLAKGIMTLITEEQSRLSTEQMTPALTLQLLKVLGIATANHDVYKPLQDRESLLQTTMELLDRAHLCASSKHVTSQIPTSMNHDESSPVFGHKRDLVRLIGNMCYKHKPNQNKIRELKGIPVILEQCNMDDQNPFISQWAILAIRNLCEDNPENQAFIANMTTQGAAPSPEFLREIGVEVEMRDGMPYIKTSKKGK